MSRNYIGTTKPKAFELLRACFSGNDARDRQNILEELSFTCCYVDREIVRLIISEATQCLGIRVLCITCREDSELNKQDIRRFHRSIKQICKQIQLLELRLSAEPESMAPTSAATNYWLLE